MSSHYQNKFIDKALEKRREERIFRTLNAYEQKDAVRISNGNQEFINFCGNDYLGLSKHPLVKQRAQAYTQKYGTGATGSRLICGTHAIHEQLEHKLASTFNREAALLFNSGFQANSTIIGTLTDRKALILADKLSHNSLLQGAISSRAPLRRFQHNSTDDLERQLSRASSGNYSKILVITESLFSMGGDRIRLKSIAKVAKEYNARLFVDEAHAVGVCGEKGLGFAHEVPGIDMVLGTCGKAFGGFGAFLLCSARIKEYLINYCPGFIYTTALPPGVVGAIDASLELIPAMDEERERLYSHIEKMCIGIHEAGYSTATSDSQIIPIMIGGNRKALELADYLKRNGFLVMAIRPPTVPEGSARLRITLSSSHTEKQITEFLAALKKYR